jgi:hypothetical protein
MDLSQTKLTKSEWASVEIPVSDAEEKVLKMIIDGCMNPEIRINHTSTLSTLIKIDISEGIEHYLFKEYFDSTIRELCTSDKVELHKWYTSLKSIKTKPLNNADQIRINNVKKTIVSQRDMVFEYVLLDFCAGVLGKKAQKPAGYYLYTLVQFQKTSILSKINKYVCEFMKRVIDTATPAPNSPLMIRDVFANAIEYIEKNPYIIRHEDHTLYSHQKTLFKTMTTDPHISKLVLYMAPTGTGKTLSPIGLASKYRVIFVCVARHVGLALAKSAISVGKHIAFAFGCETASDVRLHYYSAKEYKINKRSGGIGKVDNSVGDKVEIMICDVASYVIAMHYMLAFNEIANIVTFWDEPTITMDKPDDPLHELIHRNWCENRIPKMVLSCATLPKMSELTKTVNDFKFRFVTVDEETNQEYEPEIITIDSFECKKTISLLNKDGMTVLPHLLFDNYRDILKCVEHCEANKTLLRYFDVGEIVRFVLYLETIGELPIAPEIYFKTACGITMNNLKQYYLKILCEISSSKWSEIHFAMSSTLKPYFPPYGSASSSVRKIQSMDTYPSSQTPTAEPQNSLKRMASVAHMPLSSLATLEPTKKNGKEGILLTTRDAHTLTDGPTIFLAEDVDKVGTFYIQQSNIPASVITSILTNIESNNMIMRTIGTVEKEIADKTPSLTTTKGKELRKTEREPANKEVIKLMEQLEQLRKRISTVSLSPMYIPNTTPHQNLWLPAGKPTVKNAFIPSISEEAVREIMQTGVDNQRKILLIMGIGVFAQGIDTQYAEIMKRLAYEQRLFLIIASSDYIYGTNYQFSHGFIGKDLANMTQQKTIQAIGRIGRNNVQNEYTVRFRDDGILDQLFSKLDHNPEGIVMSRLFCSTEEDEY